MSDTLAVDGGAGSLDARFDDMLAVATVLDRTGGTCGEVALRVAAVAVDADVVASAVLSPGTAARVEACVAAVTVGPTGLGAAALAASANALLLRAAVEAYRDAEAAVAASMQAAKDTVMFVVGATTVPLVLGGTGLAAGGAALALVGDTVWHVGENLVSTAPVLLDGRPNPLQRWAFAAGVLTAADVRADVGAAVDAAPGVLGDLGQDAGGFLFDHPGTVDVVAGGSAGLVDGLQAGPVGLLFTALLGGPATDYTSGVARLRSAGARFGYLDDGGASAVRVPTSADPVAPTSVASLFQGIGSLGMPGDEDPQTGPHAGRVRVVRVPQPDGSSAWVVEIPGTQTWPPVAGTNPLDLTGNATLMADGTSTAAQGVRLALRRAMADAGVPPGQPVLLSGHSQGGIVAGALAADPGFRAEFHVTAVVTGGSPIARMPIPDDVAVLSLEHVQDPVPRLEGVANPARDGWVTVHRDVAGDVQVVPTNPVSAHSTDVYRTTGRLVDESADPSVRAMLDRLSPFLDGGGTVEDYRLVRTP